VPFTLEDIGTLTQALVLENALVTLHTDAVIGAFQVDDPQTGRARLLGAGRGELGMPAGSPVSVATQHWLCDAPAVSQRRMWRKVSWERKA